MLGLSSGYQRQSHGALLVPLALLLLLAGVVPLRAGVEPWPITPTIYSASHALVIGIGAYQDRAWPRLRGAEKDAEHIATVLRELEFTVHLIINPTSIDLHRALEDFALGPGKDPGARLLLWYAGHGQTINGESYLVPTDAPGGTEPGFTKAAYSIERLLEYFDQAEAKHALLVFDTAGSARRMKLEGDWRDSRPFDDKAREVLFAASVDQEVSDNGLFAKLFLDAMRGSAPADINGDGYITTQEFAHYAIYEMARLTGGRQTPAFASRGGKSDFVIGAVPPAAIAVPTARTQREIAIVHPSLTRGALTLAPGTAEIEFGGTVTNVDGVAAVLVDGRPAVLDVKGRFFAKVRVFDGQRSLMVTLVLKDGSLQQMLVEMATSSRPDLQLATGLRYALVISVQDYDASAFKGLRSPLADGRQIIELLREAYGFRTELETTSAPESLHLIDPTKRQLQQSLTRLVNRITDKDQLLIYFAGHGKRENDEAYWLLRDSAPDDFFSWFSASELAQTVKRMRARSVLVVSDSCYSGAMFRTTEAVPDGEEERRLWLGKAIHRKSRIFMTSGRDEPVLDGGGSGHSVYARNFIDGLKTFEKSMFTSRELHDFLLPRVGARADQEPQHGIIKPSDHDGGDFVFQRAASRP